MSSVGRCRLSRAERHPRPGEAPLPEAFDLPGYRFDGFQDPLARGLPVV